MDLIGVLQNLRGWEPALALGAAVAVLAVLLVRQGGQLRALREERSRLLGDAEISHEILATAPDGLFLWVIANGSEACSRRLAVLLGLPNGVRSSFADVLGRFTGQDAAALKSACANLRDAGDPFELLLTTKDGLRRLLIFGVRAGTGEGTLLADVLWMRDVSTIAPPGEGVSATPRDVIEALPMAAWMRAPNLGLLAANVRAQKLSAPGVSRDLAERARGLSAPQTERHLLTRSDGKPRMVDITEVPLPGGGTLGVAQDMTQKEEMEGAFARHIQAQNQVMETLATAISIFDGAGKLTFFNSAYAELWGLSPAWLENGASLGDILDKLREMRRLPEVADYKAFRAERLSLFGAVEAPIEEMLHLPDGATIRAVISPHPLGGLVFAHEDVTGHLDLERSYKTLSAVQRETLDNLYEGVCVFGADGRLKLSNPSFIRTWKLLPERLGSDHHVSDFAQHIQTMIERAPGQPPLAKEELVSSLMSRQPRRGRLTLKNGTVLDYAQVPLPDGAVLLSYLDVTDSAKVEHALIERARAMAEANMLKSEFLAGVSHDIRTPLNAIAGFASILSDEYFGELNARQKEYAGGILESAEELMGVIEGTLDLATVEAGLMKLDLDTVDVGALLGQVLGMVRERARRKGVALDFDCSAEIGWVVADEKRLKQVLFNLAATAIAVSPPGGAASIKAGRDNGWVTFTITDSGSGFSKDDLPPGLALVTRFIELHGGKVTIQHPPGRGTAIVCRLPADAKDLSQPDLFADF